MREEEPSRRDDMPAMVARLREAGCVYAEDEARLLIEQARTPHELALMVERRVAGMPLEQVVGWAEFCGLRIAMAPGVFVPRRRSEFLIREAIRLSGGAGTGRHQDRPRVVVDLCCGSGALGAALYRAIGPAELYASDLYPTAVRCALDNLAGMQARVVEGDLFDPLPRRLCDRVDILICNAPYVPTGELGLLPPEARIHEPRAALDGGPDGLDLHRRVAAEARVWLAPGGHLLIETSERQAPIAADLFETSGLRARISFDEDLDATVVIGTKPRLTDSGAG